MFGEAEKNNAYMKTLIEEFPENLSEGLEIASQNILIKDYSKFNNVLICGMGGSGIGGKLVESWIKDEINIPINFCQDYSVPNYVNSKTLVIVSSNSGNTEETLSAAWEAYERDAVIIGVCAGGKLQSLCEEWGAECIIVPGGRPPRTTLAFSIIQLTHIFVELELIDASKLLEFSSAKDLLLSNISVIHSEAKELAAFINGKELIVYSEAKDEAVAIRARQQFNENSKVLCNHHVIPEMNHNELVGWYGGSDRFGVLFLNTNDWSGQNSKRLNFSIETIKTQTPYIFTLNSKGNSMISRSLYLIHIIDWTSLYLAEKNNIDSVYIAVINDLKASLLK